MEQNEKVTPKESEIVEIEDRLTALQLYISKAEKTVEMGKVNNFRIEEETSRLFKRLDEIVKSTDENLKDFQEGRLNAGQLLEKVDFFCDELHIDKNDRFMTPAEVDREIKGFVSLVLNKDILNRKAA